jgi:bifunctional non-homologous end joining protein LigD
VTNPTYIRPQLAYDVHGDIDAVPRDGEWVIEPKLDGWRWQVHVALDSVICFGGRNGVHPTPAALEVLAQLPAGTVLDGELMAGSASSDVGRIDLTDTRVFVVFDVLSIGTHDAMHMPWSHRRPLVERVVRDVNSPKVIATSVCEKPELFRDVFATILELGGEGVVAKRKAAPYRPGSRRRDGFLKVKPQQTTDAIVRGWEWGEGASNGHRCGALKVELVETGVMTTVGYDESPAEANRLAFENRRIELNHYGWLDSGKVRHPGFGRLRPDLEAA